MQRSRESVAILTITTTVIELLSDKFCRPLRFYIFERSEESESYSESPLGLWKRQKPYIKR